MPVAFRIGVRDRRGIFMTVNPGILKWARETAGLTADEAAHALSFHDTRERSATERLMALEAGEEEPSRSVLLRMSKVYRSGLLVFYLAEPPRAGDRGQDFRTVPAESLLCTTRSSMP